MQNLQLFINNQLVDLGDEPLQLTYQINNLADVQNQQGDFSKQFKVPVTQNNRRVLGFPDEVALFSTSAYELLPAKIVQDGFEILPAGLASIESVESDGISIIIRAGNAGFFTALGDFKIYDMGDSTSLATNKGASLLWQPYNHTWDVDNVANSQTKTSGWIWPVVDYGLLRDVNNPELDIRLMRPGFFLKTAIDLMVANTGYRINTTEGSLLSNPLYDRLIVQFANDNLEHGADYANSTITKHSVEVIKTADQTCHYGANPSEVSFQKVINAGEGNYLPQFNAYAASSYVDVEITVECDVKYSSKKHDGNFGITIVLYDPDTKEYISRASHVIYTDDVKTSNNDDDEFVEKEFKNIKLSFSESMVPQQSFRIGFTNSDGTTIGIVRAGARFTVTEKKSNVLPGQEVQCERIFPDISQKDLIKDTLQRFGLTCQTDEFSRTVTFASFADIVNNIPIARNWTNKCINQGKAVYNQLGNYAQQNNLKYKQDDGLTTVSSYNQSPMAKQYFDDVINIKDATLPAIADLFESVFSPSQNTSFMGEQVARITKIDAENDANQLSVSTEPRILIDNKVDLTAKGKQITFTDGKNKRTVNGVVSMPYFHKSAGAYTLSWKDLDNQRGLRSTYYHELEKILVQAKRVIHYFLLSPQDIEELDLLIPIYLRQDGAYYYISRIDSWVKNQPCKVELVKLG